MAGSNRDQLIAESFGYYMTVIKNPNASQKDKNQARKQADELLGLNAPKKIAPTTPDGKNPYQAAVKQLSNADLQLLANLKERSSQIVSGVDGCGAN